MAEAFTCSRGFAKKRPYSAPRFLPKRSEQRRHSCLPWPTGLYEGQYHRRRRRFCTTFTGGLTPASRLSLIGLRSLFGELIGVFITNRIQRYLLWRSKKLEKTACPDSIIGITETIKSGIVACNSRGTVLALVLSITMNCYMPAMKRTVSLISRRDMEASEPVVNDRSFSPPDRLRTLGWNSPEQ